MERTENGGGMCHFSRKVEDKNFTYYQELTVVESLPHFDTEWIDLIQFSKKTGERVSSYPVETEEILN